MSDRRIGPRILRLFLEAGGRVNALDVLPKYRSAACRAVTLRGAAMWTPTLLDRFFQKKDRSASNL